MIFLCNDTINKHMESEGDCVKKWKRVFAFGMTFCLMAQYAPVSALAAGSNLCACHAFYHGVRVHGSGRYGTFSELFL